MRLCVSWHTVFFIYSTAAAGDLAYADIWLATNCNTLLVLISFLVKAPFASFPNGTAGASPGSASRP